MNKFALSPNATPLDIRAVFALAKIYHRLDLAPHATMKMEALQAAERYPCTFSISEKDLAHCPLLFADEPDLVAAWNEGVAIQRAWLADLPNLIAEMEQEDAEAVAEAAHLEHLKNTPMPTGSELLAMLLAGKRVEVECHRLGLDEDGIWVVNPYGVDAAVLPPTAQACDKFIRYIRQGGEYGPTPY